MKWCLPPAALAAVLAVGAPTAPSAPDQPVDATVRKFVFLGESGPVMLGLRLVADGRPLDEAHRAAWDEYVGKLFAHLDRNGDGALDEREAAAAPPPILPGGAGGPARFAHNFAVIDSDSSGRVSPPELADYYRQFGDGPFQVRGLPGGPAPDPLAAALVRLADKDGDGKLSKEELAGLEKAALALDRDGDELIDVAELLRTPPTPPQPAAPQPAGQRVTMAAREPSLVPVAPDSARRVGDLLRTRYRMTDDEGLDRFADRAPEVVITVRLGDPRVGEPVVELTTAGPAKIVAQVEGGLVLDLAGARLELRALRDRVASAAAGSQATLVRRFHDLHAGRQGPLSVKVAGSDRWVSGLFPLLDRGDGGADEPRVRAYAENVLGPHVRAQMARAELLSTYTGRGLFDLLDRNRDGRLSRRELRAAVELPGADALPASHQLLLRLAPYDPAGVPTEDPGLPFYGTESAPLWFRKMDANRDGDISLKEFLGSREQFRRLDRDGDGLIGLAEAERADVAAK